MKYVISLLKCYQYAMFPLGVQVLIHMSCLVVVRPSLVTRPSFIVLSLVTTSVDPTPTQTQGETDIHSLAGGCADVSAVVVWRGQSGGEFNLLG